MLNLVRAKAVEAAIEARRRELQSARDPKQFTGMGGCPDAPDVHVAFKRSTNGGRSWSPLKMLEFSRAAKTPYRSGAGIVVDNVTGTIFLGVNGQDYPWGVGPGLMNSTNVELGKKAIKTLLFLLYHNYPKVRTLSASKLYTGLMAMEEHDALMPGGEDAYEEFDTMISETDWTQDLKTLNAETKVQMYAFFGHEAKLPVSKN